MPVCVICNFWTTNETSSQQIVSLLHSIGTLVANQQDRLDLSVSQFYHLEPSRPEPVVSDWCLLRDSTTVSNKSSGTIAKLEMNMPAPDALQVAPVLEHVNATSEVSTGERWCICACLLYIDGEICAANNIA